MYLSLLSLTREDEFVVESIALGSLQKVRIGHDNTGPGPAWFLDKVMYSPQT